MASYPLTLRDKKPERSASPERSRGRASRFLDDDGNHPPAIGALVLCATGYKQRSVVEHGSDDCADRSANVSLLIDIAVVQHGVRATANGCVTLRLAFDECGPNTTCLRRWNLWRWREAEITREVRYTDNVERVLHAAMCNRQWPRPRVAKTCNDDFVNANLYSRRDAGD